MWELTWNTAFISSILQKIMGIIFRYFSKIDVIIMGSVTSLFNNGYGGESGREIRGQKI